MDLNILIVGVGGQGTLLASRVLGGYAELQGVDCKLSEVHGMAQRGGSVVTHVKLGEKIYSPVTAEGDADVIVAFELLEGKRWLHYLKKGGILIVNNQQLLPMPVITGAQSYPADLKEKIKEITDKVYYINALHLAEQAGSVKTLNIVMLGALCKAINLNFENFKQAVLSSVPAKTAELNSKALQLGYSLQ